MLVMAAIAIVCVIGILGSMASASGYDQLYGQTNSAVQEPRRSARQGKLRRRSRQLRAVEAALETSDVRPTAGRPATSGHGRWSRR